MDKREVVIVSAVRTPFDKFGGIIKEISSIALAEEVLKKVVERANMPKEIVEYIFYGTTYHAEIAPQTNIPVRQALLRAGFLSSTLSLTVDRACCSSMTAFQLAYKEIMSGEIEVAIAAGAENLSNVPHLVCGARWGKRIGDLIMIDLMANVGYEDWNPVSVDASEVALEHGVGRDSQDRWALQSHQRWFEAKEKGIFKEEIIPLAIKDNKGNEILLDEDQAPRPDTTLETLSKLPTVYNTETITAGNAPGLNAGAGAILMMTKNKALELGLKEIAYVRDITTIAVDARSIATAPASCIKKMVNKKSVTLKDIDLIEINEAFAAMPLVSLKILADGNEEMLNQLYAKTNVNGGAIAIGHPMGASGCRIIMTLMYELRRRNGGIGIAAICGGLGQAECVMLECPKE